MVASGVGMSFRWYVWLLVLIPALFGFVSLTLEVGDMRSSGFLAGLALTIGGLAILLLVKGRWRAVRGVRRMFALAPAAALGGIAVLGLAIGVPEFAQAQFGWFMEPDAYGPRAIVVRDGTFVVVGDERPGAVILRSHDGRSWSRVGDASVLEGLQMRDALVTDAGIVAVGQPSDDAVGQVLTSPDAMTWHAASRFGPGSGFGIAPIAVAASDDGLIAVGSTYGNDAAFFHSADGQTWTTSVPAPVFDDGESPIDVACAATVCVTVGERYTTGSLVGGTRRAITWTSSDGEPWVLSDGVFGTAMVTAVTTFDDGFVASGYDDGLHRAMLWTSPNGRIWTPVDDQPGFHRAQMDGLTNLGGTVVAFGRDLDTDAIVVWTSDGTSRWQRSTVDDNATTGSRIRAITTDGDTTAAVGVDTAHHATAVWTSEDMRIWRKTIVADRPTS